MQAMTQIYELETERLQLRQWRKSDKEPFARLNGSEQVMAYFPSTLSTAESDKLAERIADGIASNGWGFWAVEVKDKHPFIGFVGLNRPRYELPFGPCVEVGWRLDSPYWGNGYATEAASAAIAFAFQTLALEKVVSFTALVNVRSQAVMRRLRMERASETFLHPNVPAGHELQEHCLYELSQERWLSIMGSD